MIEIVAGFAPLTTAAGAGNGGDGEGSEMATVKAFEENGVGEELWGFHFAEQAIEATK